jgi:hypothetical protein
MNISEELRNEYIFKPLETLHSVVEAEFGDSPKKPHSWYRGTKASVRGRQYFILIGVDIGIPKGEMATFLRVDPSLVTKSGIRLDKLRNDPLYKKLLQRTQRQLRKEKTHAHA